MSNSKITTHVYGDLLALAQALRTSGPVSAPKAASLIKQNARYARELLGLLGRGGLGAESGATGEFALDHWDTDAEFLAVFEDAFGGDQAAKPVKATKAVKARSTKTATAANTPCACGCGQGTNRGRQFRPGHDARMVAQLVAAVVSTDKTKAEPKVPVFGQGWAEVVGSGDIQHRIDLAANLVERNFSSALGAKAHRAMMAHWAKVTKAPAATKAPKANWVKVEPVKVGRWTYPTRARGGITQRNTKRDGSGEWVAI